MTKQFTPDQFRHTWTTYVKETQKLVVGNADILELIVAAMVADGHVLLQSVPGLGKTVIGNSMGTALKDGCWGFFPFTADLLPSDVKGSEVYNEATKQMEVMKGAIHSEHNIFVADEINRATPKTVGALLAVMEERKIVIGDKVFPMSDPSVIIGTQNPIEQEGTYPLPEAMLDRFAVMGRLDYLTDDQEFDLLNNDAIFDRDPQKAAKIQPVLTPEDVIAMRDFVRRTVTCTETMTRYMVNLMRGTRPGTWQFEQCMPADFKRMVRLGGSQRTSKWLKILSKAAAAMRGSDIVQVEDVRKMFVPCVAHKIILTPDVKARRKGENVEIEILKGLMEKVPTAA